MVGYTALDTIPVGVLLNSPVNQLHPMAYNEIDKELIMKVAYATTGGTGRSGLDALQNRRQ